MDSRWLLLLLSSVVCTVLRTVHCTVYDGLFTYVRNLNGNHCTGDGLSVSHIGLSLFYCINICYRIKQQPCVGIFYEEIQRECFVCSRMDSFNVLPMEGTVAWLRHICPTPTTVENATIKGDDLYEGSWIEYVCSSGSILSGPGNFTCTADGAWERDTGETELPECLKVCMPPPNIENGERSGDDVVVGSIITYGCQGEYTLVGPSVFKCAETVNWVPDGPCSMDDTVDVLLTFPPRCVIENCTVKSSDAYIVHNELETWTGAAATCKTNGGHLVSFSCEDEFLFVKGVLPASPGWAYHIGATDIDFGCYWTWIDSPDEFTFAAWALGEPNNFDGIEHHTMIRMDQYVFTDIPSSASMEFICEMEPGN